MSKFILNILKSSCMRVMIYKVNSNKFSTFFGSNVSKTLILPNLIGSKKEMVENNKKLELFVYKLNSIDDLNKYLNKNTNKFNKIIDYSHLNQSLIEKFIDKPFYFLTILKHDISLMKKMDEKEIKTIFILLEKVIYDNFFTINSSNDEKFYKLINEFNEKFFNLLFDCFDKTSKLQNDFSFILKNFLKNINKIEFKDNLLVYFQYNAIIKLISRKYLDNSNLDNCDTLLSNYEPSFDGKYNYKKGLNDEKKEWKETLLFVYKEYVLFLNKEKKYFKDSVNIHLDNFKAFNKHPSRNYFLEDSFQIYFSGVDESLAKFIDNPNNSEEKISQIFYKLITILVKDPIICLYNTNGSLVRYGIYKRDLFENQELLYTYLFLMKFVMKTSISNKSSWNSVKTFFHYFNYYMDRFPEKVKDLKTPILIHIIYTYGYYSFNLNEKVISEIRLRIPSIMENFVSQRIMILTSGLALLGKSDNNLFNCIMSNEKLKEIKYSKTFINIAYHIAMTKYDNFLQWKNFFDRVMKFKLNNLDKKMILDIIEFINLIDEKYLYFRDKYYDRIINTLDVAVVTTNYSQSF